MVFSVIWSAVDYSDKKGLFSGNVLNPENVFVSDCWSKN